ncbi:MAG: hypothetical protein CO184_01865 [Candidatus Zambryskibacteria bacterium CG_4_9_14_3_um_filter_40_16]|uniref:Uncharacterized protein n=2 Tax=Candidatus Zambryskiibacteriota TaxID=1817925 RepID=A0A2H0K657_9BACT|nr:MAG: hypothetical protein COV95_02575 [Candidatus Zambryskibacteria bacterium CG11_big_fil_rev_8_21_14_0_20_40_24]PJA33475.1 MAG: hypothetical protein CO184_01865 [Candidatus Zambryskibacteria bacterium CG_4_9_14_3_um_filter_40_16]
MGLLKNLHTNKKSPLGILGILGIFCLPFVLQALRHTLFVLHSAYVPRVTKTHSAYISVSVKETLQI